MQNPMGTWFSFPVRKLGIDGIILVERMLAAEQAETEQKTEALQPEEKPGE